MPTRTVDQYRGDTHSTYSCRESVRVGQKEEAVGESVNGPATASSERCKPPSPRPGLYEDMVFVSVRGMSSGQSLYALAAGCFGSDSMRVQPHFVLQTLHYPDYRSVP